MRTKLVVTSDDKEDVQHTLHKVIRLLKKGMLIKILIQGTTPLGIKGVTKVIHGLGAWIHIENIHMGGDEIGLGGNRFIEVLFWRSKYFAPAWRQSKLKAH